VLRRSGTALEQKYAKAIEPVSLLDAASQAHENIYEQTQSLKIGVSMLN
jgi:hypothetical protein